MAARAPHLHRALRCFCLAGFSLLAGDLEAGDEIPFAFEEHPSPGRPSLYEYRPLVRTFVVARTERLAELRDAHLALEELQSEPAAAIYARAHADAGLSEADALVRTVLVPLLATTAEACGGFDWDERAFERSYDELERSLFRDERAYAAIAPLVGVSVGAPVDVGPGLRIRRAAAGELAAHWPEAASLLPARFGREPDRLCVIELERALPPRAAETPDAPGDVADAVTAVRLVTAGPVAAGPVLFERLDWRPLGVRPVLPIAGAQPGEGEVRLDAVRAAQAARLLERLARVEDDEELADALDRWELSLFQAEPSRSEQLREALAALLGRGDGSWAAAVRAAMLLGEAPRERGALLERLRPLAAAGRGGAEAADVVRRAFVETLLHEDRRALVRALDEALLGARPRPAAGQPSRDASGTVPYAVSR